MQTIRCSALLDLVERIRPPTHCITPEPYLKEMQFFHREMFKPYIVRLFFFLDFHLLAKSHTRSWFRVSSSRRLSAGYRIPHSRPCRVDVARPCMPSWIGRAFRLLVSSEEAAYCFRRKDCACGKIAHQNSNTSASVCVMVTKIKREHT